VISPSLLFVSIVLRWGLGITSLWPAVLNQMAFADKPKSNPRQRILTISQIFSQMRLMMKWISCTLSPVSSAPA